MTVVRVRTECPFPATVEKLWPLLCDSRVDRRSALLSFLHVPQPIRCRLPGGAGGVGEERECESDQGLVHQRILEWVPRSRLSFRMERATLPQRGWIEGMSDEFDLVPQGAGSLVTRTTQVRVRGRFRIIKGFLLILGLRQVHRIVFRSWRSSAG